MITLRPWLISDNGRIEELEKLYFKSPWNLSMLNSCFAANNFYGLVFEDDGRVIAYIGCAYDEWDVDVLNVCVDKDYRRQKLATKMFEEAFKHFRELKAERIFLEVRVSNVGAIKLYESLGFAIVGIRKKYYENTEDALVMAFSL